MRYFCLLLVCILFSINSIANSNLFAIKAINKVCDFELNKTPFECDVLDGDYQSIFNKLNVVVIRKFFIEDRLVVEGYSSYINDYVVVNGVRVNIQVSQFGDKCVLGVPLIRNSF